MDKSKIKEKIISNHGYKTAKFTVKFFIIPFSFLMTFFAFRFFKFFYRRVASKKALPTRKKTINSDYLDYEKVNFKNETPFSLEGWFIKAKEKPFFSKAPTIILCHGLPADKKEVLNRAEFLMSHYNIFLFDFRALGKSKGIYSSLGFYEQRDLVAAINYLKKRPEVDENKIGLFGFSMGASVSLMVATKFPKIKAIVAESPYASLEDMFKYAIQRNKFFYKALIIIAITIGKFLFRFNIRKVLPQEAVKDINIPLFVIHSRDDEIVPFKNGKLIFESANEPKSFWAPTGSQHGKIIDDYPEEYQKRIKSFFNKYLK